MIIGTDNTGMHIGYSKYEARHFAVETGGIYMPDWSDAVVRGTMPGAVLTKEEDGKMWHAIVCGTPFHTFGYDRSSIRRTIRWCFDTIPADDEPIVTDAVVSFIGAEVLLIDPECIRQAILGMHDSKANIVVRTGRLSLEEILEFCNKKHA
ncbi:hypothetical protein FWH09_02890 [Candidatus Saccharibacteria bacterium]|nr:hypothetical protein [Candidatus Saccharibacteria bacterium]